MSSPTVLQSNVKNNRGEFCIRIKELSVCTSCLTDTQLKTEDAVGAAGSGKGYRGDGWDWESE